MGSAPGDGRPLDLQASARLVMRAAPSGFVAERTRLVADAVGHGDRELAEAIRSLRKPSVAAWVLNVLAHEHPGLLADLEQLSSALGEAQASGDRATLRSLSAERRSLIEALVSAATEAAGVLGHPPSQAVVEAVRQSLQAASADAVVADQLASGLLVDAPTSSGSGWGTLAIDDAAPSVDDAAPALAVTTDPSPGDDRRQRLRNRLVQAELDTERATRAAAEAESDVVEAASALAALLRERDELTHRLDTLDADLADAARAQDRRQRAADRARREAVAAEAQIARLRTALDGE